MSNDNDYKSFNKEWLKNNNITIDWIVEERNAAWHQTYFTKRATKDHQAKGNCRFAWLILEEMEQQGWLSKGDFVLDPMCGIGSFLIVAALLGYNAIGVELEDRFIKDMRGFTEVVDSSPDDLFADFANEQHVQGCIERFHEFTAGIKGIGRIKIFQGDARNLSEILGSKENADSLSVLFSPPYGNRLSDEMQKLSRNDKRTWAEVEEDSDGRRQYSNDPDNIGTNRVSVISSPPYSSQTEIGGKAKDPNKAGYFQRMQQKTNQYSEDNLARSKLGVLCSPPYSRSTEHDEDQINHLPKDKKHGFVGFAYTDRANIAVLQLGEYDREMLKVYKSLYDFLPPGTAVALITRNFIQQGKMVLLDELTIKLMENAGFVYQFTKRATLPEVSMFKYMNWNTMHKDKELPLITWEEATFYVKPRSQKLQEKENE